MDFEVRHIDGTTVKLISSEHKCAITSATQTRKLCGNDTVTINLQSATYIDFYVGDKITIFGTTYTLNQLPTVKKESERSYTYTLVFEGLQYTLIDRVFLMPDNTQGDNLMFDLAGMLDVLDDNINRGNSGKQYEFVLDESLEETEYKNLSLTGKNCLQVLQQLCQEWDTEFVFAEEPTRIAIYIGVAGSTFAFPFTYGRGGGVYELNREKGASDICTRLFVYGGTQNLTYYRHNRLCLPSKEKNQSYVEDATAQAVYGIKEQVKNFDDIYPNRIGTITSLSGCDYNEFIDSAMADAEFGFDLNEKWANNADDCEEWLALKGLEDTEANRTIYYNDVADTATKYLMAGATAKIHFNTGALAGYECDLHSYTHSSQKFVLKPLVDENGYDFPSKTNAAFKLAVGDEYVILDINLPTAYKTQAESKLATEAASYFDTVCRPQPKYTLTIEPIALKHIVGPSTADTEIFKVGDLINISDPTGGVESATIRIDQFVRNLLDPFDYKLTLTDEITYSQQVRTLIEVDAIKRVVEESKIYDVNRIRRGWKDAEELYNQMFDTEGHYYSEKIAPLSIDTQMLKVGARSQQLVLQNVLFQPNYNADPANLQISAGSLVHYTIAEPDIKTWTMSALSASNVPSTAQYVYAKCARNGTTGTWLVTDEAIVFDSELYPNDYHFLVGSLSSVDSVSNTRNFAATYGFTTINGRNITTGVIKSADGSGVIIDLDNNTITGNIKFLSGGQAVDAEQYINNEVGTAVEELNIAGVNVLPTMGYWEQGTASTGSSMVGKSWEECKINASTQRLRLINTRAVSANTKYTVSINSNYSYELDLFNTSNKLIGYVDGWKNTAYTFDTGSNVGYVAFIVKKNDDSVITTADLQTIKIKLEKGEVATDWTPAPEDVGSAVTTASDAKNTVDNLQIGGANIARATENITIGDSSHRDWQKSEISIGGSGTGTRSVIKKTNSTPAKTDVVQIAQTSTSSGECSIAQSNITKLVVGETYTLSCYAKATGGSPNLYLQLDAQTKVIAVTSSWVRYSLTAIHAADQTGRWFIGSYNSNGTIQICGIKLEQGTVATDWTPAPEDTAYLQEALAQSQSTEINGGLVLTSMVELRNTLGQVMAGIAGIGDIALWGGGSLTQALTDIANVIIRHNGSAKLGNLDVNTDGSITMRDSGGQKTALSINSGNISVPQSGSVINKTSSSTSSTLYFQTYSGTVYAQTGSTNIVGIPITSSVGSVHDGMMIHVKNVSVKIYGTQGYWGTFTAELVAGAATHRLLFGTYRAGDNTYSESAELSLVFRYASNANSIGFNVKATEVFAGTSSGLRFDYSIDVAYYHDPSSQKVDIGSNGFISFKDLSNYFRAYTDSNNVFRTEIAGAVKIKSESIDMPGVLWAGEVQSGGGLTASFKNSAVTLQLSGTGPSDTSLYNFSYSGISGTPIIIATPKVLVADSYGWTAMIENLSTSNSTFSVRVKRGNSKVANAFHLIILGKT